MERVYKSVDLRIKMEALVHDLTHALEESSRTTPVRRRWGLRKRTRSVGNLTMVQHRIQSDDSSSSIGRELVLSKNRCISAVHQSDSDDVGPANSIQKRLVSFNLKPHKVSQLHGNFESDSFNENFSPVHPNTRRKRKCKRMAVDPVQTNKPSTSHAVQPVVSFASVKKKRVVRHAANCENRFNNIVCGKRKRSVRERSVDCEQQIANRAKPTRSLALRKMGIGCPEPGKMDFTNLDSARCEIMSSSSLSSSESDTGIYTNDEGREGDDEQSDWFGGETGTKDWRGEEEKRVRPRRPAGIADDTDNEDSEPPLRTILSARLEQLSDQLTEAYRIRMQWLQGGLHGREIRAGRRRLRGDRPGFSIVTSANEQLSRFLRDPGQSQLRLHPMQQQEQEQLSHLANLYSLSMSSDSNRRGLTCPVLTKTRNTTQAVRVEQGPLAKLPGRLHNLNDFKKRRQTSPICMAASQLLDVQGHSSHQGTPQEADTAAIRPKLQGLKLTTTPIFKFT